MRELKLDNKVDYTIERNPLQSILGRMGAEMGKGLSESVAQRLETSQNAKLQ